MRRPLPIDLQSAILRRVEPDGDLESFVRLHLSFRLVSKDVDELYAGDGPGIWPTILSYFGLGNSRSDPRQGLEAVRLIVAHARKCDMELCEPSASVDRNALTLKRCAPARCRRRMSSSASTSRIATFRRAQAS